MIGSFPDPNPDELFYSACARYQDCSPYRGKYIVGEELFGKSGLTARVHLPQHLDYFVESLPPQSRYTPDNLIDEHTALPFFSPFVCPDRVRQARADMKGGSNALMLNNVGVQSGHILLPDWLRFCPACAEDDKRSFGYHYWHRVHQLPSVEVCPDHGLFLEDSNVRIRYRASSYEYVSAAAAVVIKGRCPIDRSNPVHQALLDIARNVKWLLSQRDLLPGCQAIADCYLRLLIDNGLATHGGFIRREKLRNFLAEKCPPELWGMLRNVTRERNNWLVSMVRKIRTGSTVHPLLHLLMMHALGCTAEEFFGMCVTVAQSRSTSDDKPFGEAPWPCLNKTNEHYGQPTVLEYNLTYTRWPNRRPKGVFECACGFAYVRIGPDASAEDRYKIRWIEWYGARWEKTLEKLWADPSLSIQEICERVGLGQWGVLRRQVIRLGLPSPRVGPRGMEARWNSDHSAKPANNHIPDQVSLMIYRREWLEGRKKNPELLTTKELVQDKVLALIYRRLLKYDREWLSTNAPPDDHVAMMHSALANSRKSYWEDLDAQLEPLVKVMAQQLKEKSGRPTYVSRTAIARELGFKTQAVNKLDKLPKTADALAKVVESRLEFAIRRIQWAAAYFREEGIIPTRTQLKHKACIGRTSWNSDEIRQLASLEART